MKMTIQHLFIRSTDEVDSLVEERILSLQPRVEIEEAWVRLERRHTESPAFRATIHLVTPGPDLKAEGQDHTIRAAIEKVASKLDDIIAQKQANRTRRTQGRREGPHALRGRRGSRLRNT